MCVMYTITPLLRFSALRRYDIQTGVGDVVAVFFFTEQPCAERNQARQRQSSSCAGTNDSRND